MSLPGTGLPSEALFVTGEASVTPLASNVLAPSQVLAVGVVVVGVVPKTVVAATTTEPADDTPACSMVGWPVTLVSSVGVLASVGVSCNEECSDILNTAVTQNQKAQPIRLGARLKPYECLS